MNYSSTTEQTSPGKFSSLGSSMTATEFAKTENELNALQNEILTQGQEIEQFIQYHSNSHKSTPTFHALQMLFELFKSELSMNLTLRRSLIEEKENNQQNAEYIEKLEKEKKQFFHQISEGSASQINEYSQVISFVIDQMRIAEKSLNRCKKSKSRSHSYSKLEKDNKLLTTEINQLQNDNQALRMQLHNLKGSIQSASIYEVENQKLKSQIQQIRSSNEELQAQFSLDYAKINAKVDIATQKIESVTNENNQLKENLTKLSNLISSQKEKIKILRSENENLKTQLSNNSNQLKTQVDEITQQNECLKKQVSDYQNEILNSQASFKDMETKLKSVEILEGKIQRLRFKNEKLKAHAKKNENAVSLLQQCKDSFIASRKQVKQYKAKIESLEKQLKEQKFASTRVEELRSKIHILEEANQKIISNIQSQAKEQTNAVSQKLKNLESKFESIQNDYSSVSNENQRLYSQLRQSSLDMQRLETENARLSTTIERLNRDINDTKSTIWLSGKNSNDSSYSANVATREYQNNNNNNYNNSKSKTYYIDDDEENINDELPANDESDIIQPAIVHPSRRFGRNSKANLNSAHPESLNVELQNEMNSLQNEIESLKREMGRTD